MSHRMPHWMMLAAMWAGSLSAAEQRASAATLQAPDTVRMGLHFFLQAEEDMNRKISARAFARLPHACAEFSEAVGVVHQGVAAEPAEFRSRLEPLLKKALDADANLAALSKSGDEQRLRAALKRLTAAAAAIIEMFPEPVRPATDPTPHPARALTP